MTDTIKSLFNPRHVAVLGASEAPGKVGRSLVENLVASGYKGTIHPVNPKGGTIAGIPVLTDIADLPSPLDLAIISLPPAKALEVFRELAELPVRAVIVVASGFKETSRDGWRLEREIADLAQARSICLLGPNSIGLINTANGLNASFAYGMPQPGGVAFFSQSGSLCTAVLDWSHGENVGFSKFVSFGNKAILDETAILEYLAEDDDTRVITGYVESIEAGESFFRIAESVTRKKPIILLKGGVTPAGARAVSRHTGAVAGSDVAYEAAFKRAGILRVHDVRTMFDLAKAFTFQEPPSGPNLAIVTNSGGPAILAADACERSSLHLAKFSNATVDRLKEFLPSFAAFYNPVDIIGDSGPERYRQTLAAVLPEPSVDSLLVMLTPTGSARDKETAEVIVEAAMRTNKTIVACFMGDRLVYKGREILTAARIPCYPFPEAAIRSLNALYAYGQWRRGPYPVQICYRRDMEKARLIINQARKAGIGELSGLDAQGILKAYEIPTPETFLARTGAEAVSAAKRAGYPVALKLISPHIRHRSDVGAVRLNLRRADEVQAAFLEITSLGQRLLEGTDIVGCLVQAMAPRGSKEVLIHLTRDKQFGPLLSLAVSGISFEVLHDLTFRLAPLNLTDASDMIRELHSFPLLRGVRGEQPVDFKALEDVILTMSQLAVDFPEIAEAWLDPVLVHPKGILAADIRISLA